LGIFSVPHTAKYLQEKLGKVPQMLLSTILEITNIKKGMPDMFQKAAGPFNT
jgi:hypothetical protein